MTDTKGQSLVTEDALKVRPRYYHVSIVLTKKETNEERPLSSLIHINGDTLHAQYYVANLAQEEANKRSREQGTAWIVTKTEMKEITKEQAEQGIGGNA